VVMTGEKGNITGGKLNAAVEIACAFLGNAKKPLTELIVGVIRDDAKRLAALKQQMEEGEDELAQVDRDSAQLINIPTRSPKNTPASAAKDFFGVKTSSKKANNPSPRPPQIIA